jgi:Uma2 family endonuclease
MTKRADEVPPLCAGDRLSRDEFERRHAAMPLLKKAELVEGVVYVPSPVSHTRHGGPHALLGYWLRHYSAETPGCECSDNATVRLDLDNEPQPDLLLRLRPECGGKTTLSGEGYFEGAPELVVEITASRVAYDLHDKLQAYRRNGVQEYLVWRVDEQQFDWFVLRGGSYQRQDDPADGVQRSAAFPGLWLDFAAALADDGRALRATLDRGLASSAHAVFVAALDAARSK